MGGAVGPCYAAGARSRWRPAPLRDEDSPSNETSNLSLRWRRVIGCSCRPPMRLRCDSAGVETYAHADERAQLPLPTVTKPSARSGCLLGLRLLEPGKRRRDRSLIGVEDAEGGADQRVELVDPCSCELDVAAHAEREARDEVQAV